MDIEAEKAAERIKARQAVTGTAADIHERDLDISWNAPAAAPGVGITDGGKSAA